MSDVRDENPAIPFVNGDPVIVALRQVEDGYMNFRGSWQQQAGELEELREKLAKSELECAVQTSQVQRVQAQVDQVQKKVEEAQAQVARTQENAQAQIRDVQERSNQLAARVETIRAEAQEAQERAERNRARANQLATSLKSIHRSLFSGNIYELILKACLTITGATRGMYITARGADDALRIRAAIDVDGYPKAPPSEFIKALCHKVLDENDSFVCNDDGDFNNLPKPDKAAEQFDNCLVAPVVLLKNFDGIIIAADKINGEFNEDDVETLLSVGDQAAVAVENIQLQRELQTAYLSTVSMLADAVEAKDAYTQGHCELVSRYARLTADQLDLSDYDKSLVCYAALLHDVGKIGVSDGILNKPGPLLPEERELMRAHVRVGHDLICKVPALESVAEVVLHHHEWYDGSGYPGGIKGEDIHIAARIVCVVDAYCAMITKRSYKEAYNHERALEELQRCAGTQFDPDVVDAFLAMLETAEAQSEDDDYDAECGVLPGFTHIRELQQLAS